MAAQLDRRAWLTRLTAVGIGGIAFQRALAHKAVSVGEITTAMIQEAEWIADIELTDQEREALQKQLIAQRDGERKLRDLKLDVDVGPASVFRPYFFAERVERDAAASRDVVFAIDPSWSLQLLRPRAREVDWSNEESIAHSGIIEQAIAIRSKSITSLALTELYLRRLKKADTELKCVVTLTEELAREQAAKADQELLAGKDRGILHGIPWGAKDIIAVPPFRTTWGGQPFREQVRPDLATVANRLNAAGGVMLAKLSVGTYAMGDIWFDGTTKNPWNTKQGSSGSSAGSAAAVAAGLCTFAIGSETLGSIVSPARRCRVSGLRPSFGRVSRFGCMPLSWTMDKIGPIARRAIDCGIVLSHIQGEDQLDPSVVERPLELPNWESLSKLKIGYVDSQLSESEKQVFDLFKSAGAELVPITYPDSPAMRGMLIGLDVESASVFEELFRTAQSETDFGLWGPEFRSAQFVRGTHYVQSLRARSLLIEDTERVLRTVDVVLGSDDLLRTNLTGHPSIIVSCGSQTSETGKAMPRTIKLTSRYFADGKLVAVGDWIQRELPPMPELPRME
jgi:Asp-tRNA(Asn)/Glu-tRNA(Gln) amidotransferase A subunit family amidase